MLFPHPPVLLSQIRVHDIWLLLAIGGLWELTCRTILLLIKRKPFRLLVREQELVRLQQKTADKRKLGPPAFVETSKLERQVLAIEKELTGISEGRKKRAALWEKRLLNYGNIQLACLIFFLYYSIPLLSIESGPPVPNAVGTFESPTAYTHRILFPLSYAGLGLRISRFGMLSEHAPVSIGALVVMWSAQVTVGKLMDGLDAFVLMA